MEEVRLSAFDSWQKFDHNLHMHAEAPRCQMRQPEAPQI